MANISRRCQDAKNFPPVEVRGIVKVSRQEERDLSRQMYWTETVDISAHANNGRKLFESFHVLAVPEGELATFKSLRRQARKSFGSEFVKTLQSLCEEGNLGKSSS